MLPSTTLDTDTTSADLPRLTVRELRAVQHAHQLDVTYHATDDGGREWRGRCSCNVALLPHRWRTGVVEAHAIHVSAAQYDARRAKALGAMTTACYHPRSCAVCQRDGRACGQHHTGQAGHTSCGGAR